MFRSALVRLYPVLFNYLSRDRYYNIAVDSPAYYASVALNREMKFDYFEQEWGKWPTWIEKAKNDVLRLMETEYKQKVE